ncbi:MAG: cytochrome-c peroxidase [Leptospiraceae bacterium]|nr:cytochrome-c peroxidase [Leptospiraceae bacterium]
MNYLRKTIAPFLAIVTAFTVSQCKPEKTELMKQANLTFGTIPEVMPGAENDTDALVTLGEKLYHENGLSANDSQSCNSCHNVNGGGVDNLPVSNGAFGDKGGRNAPTVLNAGFHLAQFWDGRAKDLAEQAKGPVLNPVEMAMKSEADVVAKIKGIAEYQELFAQAFPDESDPVTYDNIARAIAAFERTLITSDRFDDFQNGDDAALTEQEKEGLQLFMSTGCTTCHSGPLLGGHMYQKSGLVNPYRNQADQGRFEVTGAESDRYVFKVPSLRNVALTAPYFHDGKMATLDEAVQEMAWIQLGKKLSDAERESIVAFLKSLSDKERAANAQ